LTVKGQIALLQKPSVALVGARNASANGRRFTEQIAAQLGARDYVVVSGLARGIDTAAHRGSLASGTVAVLAGGLDIIYPPENAELYEEIARTGLIVAEMAMGSQPTARLFPNRNRIISGLSLGVVVVEAARRSGSLITARLAADQGREVFAVPGSPLDPRAEGSNHLIREGAHLVTQASDVTDLLEGLPQRPIAEPEIESDLLDTRLMLSQDDIDQVRKRLWTLLGVEPVAIDELVRQCDASVNTVHAALVELELAGLILRYPNHGIARHYD
jgi:DNA processing protein